MPSIRQLQYVVALADEGHFGRAARRVRVSQPALSKQVKDVEETLGVVLFERGRKGTHPTREGLVLVRHARRVLAAHGELRRVAHALTDPMSGELVLGGIPTVAPYLFPPVAERAAAIPGLRLRLVEQPTEELREGLVAGELDAALVALPWPSDEFEVWPLFEDELLRASSGGPPKPLLMLKREHCLRNHGIGACGDEHAPVEAASLATLVSMVRAGAGDALVPELARGDATGLRLESLTPPAHRTVALWLPPSSPRRELLRALVPGSLS